MPRTLLASVISFWFASAAYAGPPCAKLVITKVRITDTCTQRDDSCYAEAKAGAWTQHFPFNNLSDGSVADIGFSRTCEGTTMDGRGRAVKLPAGCKVSINYGGPAGEAGAKCLCHDDTCGDE